MALEGMAAALAFAHRFKRFKRITLGHHLIMGRKTYRSIGRPLPGRPNILSPATGNFAPGLSW